MNKYKTTVNELAIRAIITTILLSVLSTGLIYYIQKEKLYKELGNEVKQYLDIGVSKYSVNIDILRKKEEFLKYIKKIDFVLLEVYDKNKNELYDYTNLDENSTIVDMAKKHDLSNTVYIPNNNKIYYDFFEGLHHHYFLSIIYPIYVDDELLGYIEGIKTVDKNVIKKIEDEILYVIFIIMFSVFIFSLFIFPLIYIAYDKLNKSRIELVLNNIKTVNTLGDAIALRDSDTNEHNYRVSIYSIRLAQELNLEEDQIKKLVIGAFLHDVGKIGISDLILLKNGKLSDTEMEIMKQHVNKGVELIKHNDWLENGEDVILYHHERYDGNGYPNGIKGNNIPIIARVFSIVDVFDALTSKRPYKEPFSYEKSLNILYDGSNRHFDPVILKSFVKISKKLHIQISSKSEEDLKEELNSLIVDYFLN